MWKLTELRVGSEDWFAVRSGDGRVRAVFKYSEDARAFIEWLEGTSLVDRIFGKGGVFR